MRCSDLITRNIDIRAVLKSVSIKGFKILSNLVFLVADPALSRRLSWRPAEIHSNLNYTTVLHEGAQEVKISN